MGVVVWAALGLLCILSEFVVPGFVVFFFGLGALLNALLVGIVPGLASRIPLQLILWAGTSGLSLLLLRKYFARVFTGTVLDTSSDRDFIGHSAEVSEAITPDSPGRVRFQGTTWTAVAFDETIEPGERVDILEKEGTKLVVTRSFMNSEGNQ